MAMTSTNMAPAVPANPIAAKSNISAEQLKAAATHVTAAQAVEDPLANVKAEFEDQIEAETRAAKIVLEAQQKDQASISSLSMRDLTEDDAYNLDIAIAAGKSYSPSFLKIVLKDTNYVARWGNTNTIRQGMLVAQGFKPVRKEDVANLEELEMHLDSQDHFTWADLTAVKTTKASYYAGIRLAYVKSLHATNSKKASEAGAVYAKGNLTGSLSGQERSYIAAQETSGTAKQIYNPNIGV